MPWTYCSFSIKTARYETIMIIFLIVGALSDPVKFNAKYPIRYGAAPMAAR